MGIAITFWTLMIIIALVQFFTIFFHMKHSGKIVINGNHANEVKQNTRVVIEALKSGRIKKHILTNSAKRYDSGKTLEQYQKFLGSVLMADIINMNEEHYNG